MSLRAGLTGGIGSGKSTLATMFQTLGIPVIDTDQIARDLTMNSHSPALTQIRSAFGHSLFEEDGTLSRARLRDLVFNSPEHKKRLEAILHPLIYEEASRQYTIKSQVADIIIFDLPLLVENGTWQYQLDKILVIDCDEHIQIERVIARSGWTEEQVRAVMANQATRAQRLAVATNVITNNRISREELFSQVSHILKEWRKQLSHTHGA